MCSFHLTCRKAKLLLKKKRYLESLLEQTDTQMDNLQQMVENIEFAQIEMKVVEGLKQGNECLEQLHKVCCHRVSYPTPLRTCDVMFAVL